MTVKWVTVPFKCSCMIEEVGLLVRERLAGEDVTEFVQRCQEAASAEHRSRSPGCASTTAEYLKIPITADGVVGRAEGGTA